jgi:hypothetical protein
LSFVIAEKSWVNEVALMSGTEAAGGAALLPPAAGLVPPDELLPHAATVSPTPISAAVNARLLVNGKVFLLGPGWSVDVTWMSPARHSVRALGRTLRSDHVNTP